jgi:hypothetical protein
VVLVAAALPVRLPAGPPRLSPAAAGGRLKGDRHLAFASRTVPTGNLMLSILDMFDITADHFGDSTGRLEHI